ncbi:SLC13 family permease [Paenibacillus daejeonensis]|uniref:SLC13 family permease n=1 Tax=Paenibacillus daejeonensis TaxID=135193 RepID=UPI0003607344|nr:SLC13 family permease [Paenibacillus daejeonensis]
MEYTTTDQWLGGGWQWIVAAILFGVTYFAGITEKLSRAWAAVAAACLLIFLGIVPIGQALSTFMVWDALLLLAGMMLLTGLLGRSGIFLQAAVRIIAWAQGRPILLLGLMMLTGALLSAIVDQLGTILILVPIALSTASLLRIPVFPFLAGIIISSNIGGTATLVGSTANILIGSSADLSFLAFISELGPLLLLILLAATLLLMLVYRKKLTVSEKDRQHLLKQAKVAAKQAKDNRHRVIGWVVLAAATAGFLLHDWLSIPPYAVAWGGAVVMLVAGAAGSVKETVQLIEWNALAYIAGLLVVVGALQQTGIIYHLAGMALQITEGEGKVASQLVLWTSGLVSIAADHLALVAGAIPLIEEMGNYLNSDSQSWTGGWWALVLGAGLGSNATLLGSSASIVAAGMAGKEGKPVSFWRYCAIGVPVTLLSLAISALYLYYYHM